MFHVSAPLPALNFAPNVAVLSIHESGRTLEILKMLEGEKQSRQNQDLRGEKGRSV